MRSQSNFKKDSLRLIENVHLFASALFTFCLRRNSLMFTYSKLRRYETDESLKRLLEKKEVSFPVTKNIQKGWGRKRALPLTTTAFHMLPLVNGDHIGVSIDRTSALRRRTSWKHTGFLEMLHDSWYVMPSVSLFGKFNMEHKGLGEKQLDYQNSFLKSIDQDCMLVMQWKCYLVISINCHPNFPYHKNENKHLYLKFCLGQIFLDN